MSRKGCKLEQLEMAAKPRTLSSRLSFFYKWILPTLWILGFGFGTVQLWLQDNLGAPAQMKWGFLGGWMIGTIYLSWDCSRLKRVRVDDRGFYVSNYIFEVFVPLSEATRITQSKISNPPTITIHLRSLTDVGYRIVFIPKMRGWFFGPHPVVRELQELCECV